MAKRRHERGLTLIEILLALIVMAVGIVGILALFPTALNFAKKSMEETQGAMLSESVAEGMRNALRFSEVVDEDGTPGPDLDADGCIVRKAILTFDLQGGNSGVKYPFFLPSLMDKDAGTGKVNWRRHPDPAATTTPPTPTKGVLATPDPADLIFLSRGDGWIAAEQDISYQAGGDKSDPYHQFAFSFDVRKISTQEYLMPPSTHVNPTTNAPYTEAEVDAMETMYEFRVHVYRLVGVGIESSVDGNANKTVVSSVTVRAAAR